MKCFSLVIVTENTHRFLISGFTLCSQELTADNFITDGIWIISRGIKTINQIHSVHSGILVTSLSISIQTLTNILITSVRTTLSIITSSLRVVITTCPLNVEDRILCSLRSHGNCVGNKIVLYSRKSLDNIPSFTTNIDIKNRLTYIFLCLGLYIEEITSVLESTSVL